MLNSISLDGTWKLFWSDNFRAIHALAVRDNADFTRAIDAAVPGEVHLDAAKAGLIGEPTLGLNCLGARWIDDLLWTYRREFDVPKSTLKNRSWLVFEALDLAATIFLNGAEIGKHNNVFYPCRIETTGKLRPGKNVVAVNLEGGLRSVADKPLEGYSSIGTKRHWLRKPQFQFEWDWSTRLINVGITKSVRLEWTGDKAGIVRFTPLADLSENLETGSVRARLFVEGLSKKPVKGVLKVRVRETGDESSATVEIRPGVNPCETTLEIRKPRLWWPVGHGPQNLYTITACLEIAGKTIGERSATIGFRRVRINQDTHPKGGRYFIIEINGRKIFAKGGNFVPADMIMARIDRARYDKLTDLALEANFNMLRIWGGGMYESDDFYDLCDHKGIMVWQEFIFACAKYPVQDEAFFKNVKAEIVYNIRRLASHPSLVVWCGNNEMECGNWRGYDTGVVYPDYALFHLTIPRLLAEEAPGRFYLPSSPYSPDMKPPNNDERGDQHPWSIGFANVDFREYRKITCRFPNEGGLLGPNSLPTMLSCLPEGMRKPGSFAWLVHDNSMSSWHEPEFCDKLIKLFLDLDLKKLSLEDYAYWGGLVQGEGLREYCENFRRRMFDSASAIFWMYNDCWPATRSWTIVDYFLRRTPVFYAVRRAMAPVHVVVAQEEDKVVIFGINDTRAAIEADLRYGVFDIAGGYPVSRTATISLPPNASTALASFKAAEWKRRDRSAAFAVLERNGRLLSRNRLFMPLFKDLKWAPARVGVIVRGGQAVFESKTFAWGVCLDLAGKKLLPDNFFDVFPSIPHSVPWRSKTPPRILCTGNSFQLSESRGR